MERVFYFVHSNYNKKIDSAIKTANLIIAFTFAVLK